MASAPHPLASPSPAGDEPGDPTPTPAPDDFTVLLERKLRGLEGKAWMRLLVWSELLDAAGWCVALGGPDGTVLIGERGRVDLAKRGETPSFWTCLLERLEDLPAGNVHLSTRGIRIWRPDHEPAADPAPAAHLTPRESEILGWLRQGKTGPEIALICGCAIRTIEKHIANLYRKIGARNRGSAILGNSGHRD